MVALTFVLWFLVLESPSEGARIFSVLPSPSVSHQIFYNRYLLELHRRGHDLTVVTPYPIDNRNLTNYRQIEFRNVLNYWHSIFTGSSDSSASVRLFPELFLIFLFRPIETMCKMYLSHPEMREIIEKDEKFDLFIIEWDTFNCLIPYMRQANNVSIGITSFALGSWSHFHLGSTSPPTYVTEIGLPYDDRMSFLQRLRNALLYVSVFLYVHVLNGNLHRLSQEYFGPDVPNVADFEKEVGVVLTNYYSSTQRPRPLATNVISIGGPAFHLDGYELKTLPQSGSFLMAFIVFGLVFCATILASSGSDILAIFPTPSYSHQIVYRSYALELLKRGHNITVITTDPINDPSLKNYREIDTSFSYKRWNKQFEVASDKAKFLRWIPELFLFAFSDFMDEMCHAYLSHPEVNALIRDKIKFDLFVVEFGVSSCFYPFARQSRNNYIGIFSMSPMSFVYANVGNVATPSYLPDPLLGELSSLSFPKRIRATIFQAVAWIVYFRTMRNHHEIARKYFASDLPPLYVYERNVSTLLLNDHFTVTFPRPAVPCVVDVGGPALQLIQRTPKSLPKAEGIRILALLPMPSFSHQVFYNRFLSELHKRGHEITVATPYTVDDSNLTNYRQIDFSHLKDYWTKAIHGKFEAENIQKSPLKIVSLVSDLLLKMCDVFNSHPEMRDIVEKGEMFDLFVTEWSLVNPFYPYMKHANYSIGITSFALEPLNHYAMGSTSSPAYVPSTNLHYTDRMTLAQRLFNTFTYVITYVFIICLNLIFDGKNVEYFGPDVPSLLTLEKEVSLILTNSHFTIQTARPSATNIIPIGGPPFHLDAYNLMPLPQDLKQFLDDAKEGVIYFSLGSNVKSEAMPENKREIFLRAFSRMKQKVLWKWEADVLPGKPDNVKISKWLPQTEIFAHPNVKAFITQGGLQSVSEAVYFKIPMIVIPFFADQELNAKKLVSERVGIYIDYENLELDSFLAALNEIINDSGYKERIEKYSALTQDQPQSPLERAVWWTEYVIRHKGAKHLRSAAVDMPWYQYFLLDVFAFILAVLTVTFYTIYKIFSCITRSLFSKNKKKKD